MKAVNKKLCFIICVSDEELYNESLKYILNLNKTKDIEIEVLAIRKANSIASGYNKAMRKSDAKYKVYLHQDVFIINKNFIFDIIKLFDSNIQIGMIGVAGVDILPENGVWWESKSLVGGIYDSHTGLMELYCWENDDQYKFVQAIDGLIIVTQYDLPWREDVFNGWHFYDISQSIEFAQKGYKIIVPNQNDPWCIHDCGIITLGEEYDKYRNLLLKEYFET